MNIQKDIILYIILPKLDKLSLKNLSLVSKDLKFIVFEYIKNFEKYISKLPKLNKLKITYELLPKRFKLVDGYDLFKEEVEKFHPSRNRLENNDDPWFGVNWEDEECLDYTNYVFSRFNPRYCKTYNCFDIYSNRYKEKNNKIVIIWNNFKTLFELSHSEFIDRIYDYCMEKNVIITYNDGYNDTEENNDNEDYKYRYKEENDDNDSVWDW